MISLLILVSVAIIVSWVVWRGIAMGNAIRIADGLWLLIFGLGLFFAVYLGERDKLKAAVGTGTFMSLIAVGGIVLRGYIIRVQKQMQKHISCHDHHHTLTDQPDQPWDHQLNNQVSFQKTDYPSKERTFHTNFVDITLDSRTGLPSGQITNGPFQGTTLESLSFDQFCSQLEVCRTLNDHPSVLLLEAYLDRLYGPQWHNISQEITEPQSDSQSLMKREEAYLVLGLKPKASLQEIKEAHHHLIQRLHPDQGGSAYLAIKINQARDLLLKTAS